MREHHVEVVRTARYHTLGRAGPDLREVWFVLHGYRQLARRFLGRFRSLDDGTRLFVAPEALSRFYVEPGPGRHGPESVVGGTWMTREDRQREIRDYVAYLDRLAEIVFAEVDPGHVHFTVLGFSQGLHTAARWVTLGGWLPDRLVLWGDFIPPDLDMDRAANRFSRLDLVLVLGDEDHRRGGALAREQASRLEAAGLAPRSLRYEGGHDIHPETLEALARGP